MIQTACYMPPHASDAEIKYSCMRKSLNDVGKGLMLALAAQSSGNLSHRIRWEINLTHMQRHYFKCSAMPSPTAEFPQFPEEPEFMSENCSWEKVGSNCLSLPLNPTPFTLNPTPSTLNPNLCWLSYGIRVVCVVYIHVSRRRVVMLRFSRVL